MSIAAQLQPRSPAYSIAEPGVTDIAGPLVGLSCSFTLLLVAGGTGNSPLEAVDPGSIADPIASDYDEDEDEDYFYDDDDDDEDDVDDDFDDDDEGDDEEEDDEDDEI